MNSPNQKTGTNKSNNRKEIRQRGLKRRRELSPSARRKTSKDIVKWIKHRQLVKPKMRVACYFSTAYELDTSFLLQYLCNTACCYLPVLAPQSRKLFFSPYTPRSILRKNKFGILEPVTQHAYKVKAKELDMIFAPLVAFDSNGNRLGMGAGYYDHTLAFMQLRPGKRPFYVGLAYAKQHFNHIDSSKWDIPLHAVITESGFHSFSSSQQMPYSIP